MADESNARFITEKKQDGRSGGELDCDRVLYAAQFARLAEITQVVSPERGYVFHNRLTHSLKVAQIARRIAQILNNEQAELIGQLGGLDVDAVEAAARAHDLGHPPFGHAGEDELHKAVTAAGLPDGYEGNAQSFRIVARLASSDALRIVKEEGKDSTGDREDPISGLNLTRQCLDALLKYPWLHGRGPKNSKELPTGEPNKKEKWGCYDSEKDIFEWVRQGKPAHQRSLGAEIMDWADDITYAIHDLLDFFRAGTMPLDRLGRDCSERDPFLNGAFQRNPEWADERGLYETALESLTENFPFDPERRFTDSVNDRKKLYEFATNFIRPFVGAIRVQKPSPAEDRIVHIDPAARRQVDLMKEFTWHYVILNPDLAVVQAGQRRAVRSVFRKLLITARKGLDHAFPQIVRNRLELAKGSDSGRIRAVADYLAEMTEKEIMRLYRQMEGTS